jgi:hypothetical protein
LRQVKTNIVYLIRPQTFDTCVNTKELILPVLGHFGFSKDNERPLGTPNQHVLLCMCRPNYEQRRAVHYVRAKHFFPFFLFFLFFSFSFFFFFSFSFFFLFFLFFLFFPCFPFFSFFVRDYSFTCLLRFMCQSVVSSLSQTEIAISQPRAVRLG